MFVDQLAAAIDGAPTLARVDDAVRLLWRGNVEGVVDDGAAARLTEAAERRRAEIRGRQATGAGEGTGKRHKPCRSPDRQRSLERRRQLAMSGAVPGRIA